MLIAIQKLRSKSMLSILLILLLTAISCKDDNSNSGISKKTKEINNFIYDNMMGYYLWNGYIPVSDPDSEPDPFAFFDKLLYTNIDHWSFITDDYAGLMAYFAGIQLSNGLNFQLYRFGSSGVIGVVQYVDANSAAERAGIKRGDIFYKVDGIQLNLDNYYDLITQTDYTLTFGYISNSTIQPLSPSVSLIAEELTINPIHYYDILNVNNSNVGYLVLTQFQENNEDDLKTLFEEFAANNVSDLILDLRYNPGGTISTAKLLASLIGPSTIAGKTMVKKAYNGGLDEYLHSIYSDDNEIFVAKFDTVEQNLNLSRLFVLTTSGTASASEMVIYCLEPYMNVIQIGDQTVGKYYGSITISEEEKHNWAIQPIIMRSENATNSIDYSKGLPADFSVDDDYDHDLGDPSEALLSNAISIISGATSEAQESLKSTLNISELASGKYLLHKNAYNMYDSNEKLKAAFKK